MDSVSQRPGTQHLGRYVEQQISGLSLTRMSFFQ